jgi:appr-1-p processing domain protein
LIEESGMDDVTVYKKANIDRKVFSRIRCKENYKPKKKTAVAFAIALQLDMPTMMDLLSRAEIAFLPSNKFDLIITYFITNKVYDIYEINAALFKYDQPILGE